MITKLVDWGKALFHKNPSLVLGLPFLGWLDNPLYRASYYKTIDHKMDEYLHGRFEEIKFEVTNQCNADCIMCPNSVLQRPRVMMEMGLFKHIMDEIAAAGMKPGKYGFSGVGEPTLDDTLPEKVAYIKSKGSCYVDVVTNGTRLGGAYGQALLDAGLDEIRISFHGITKDSYEAIMRKLAYQDTLKAVWEFMRMKRRGPLKVIFYCIPLEANKHEVERYEQFWRDQGVGMEGVEIKKPIPMNIGGKAISFKSPWALPHPKGHLWPCRSMGGTLLIEATGRVALCHMDAEIKYPVGQFGKDALKTILENKREVFLRQRRRDFSAHPICLDCSIMTEQTLAWWG